MVQFVSAFVYSAAARFKAAEVFESQAYDVGRSHAKPRGEKADDEVALSGRTRRVYGPDDRRHFLGRVGVRRLGLRGSDLWHRARKALPDETGQLEPREEPPQPACRGVHKPLADSAVRD